VNSAPGCSACGVEKRGQFFEQREGTATVAHVMKWKHTALVAALGLVMLLAVAGEVRAQNATVTRQVRLG
jgi:hypothetical protein